MELVIGPTGEVRCVYSEELELAALGELTIRRASHVEPDDQGQWWADLAPVEGPKLGPFDRRSAALVAEQAWLKGRWLAE
jgi:hypothetical protein